MLERIFLQVINMSYIGSIVIVLILATRLLLAKTPKKYSYILWAVALVRLIVPISFESVMSLMQVNPTPISNNIFYDTSPNINTGMPNIDQSISNSLPAADVGASVNPMQVWIFFGSLLWILGIAVLLIYGSVSLRRIKIRLEKANCEKGNIYRSDNVETPFVLGLIQPKIYLPAFLSDGEKDYIVLHEQTHIKRFDHVIRFISYLALCIHWFNPLVWIAFWLSGKDMEMSCDESVINQLGHSVKRDYSQSLLNLATGRMKIGLTPLAFGEGDTKGRIKNILNYKKPMFWVLGFTFFVIIILAIGLLTNPEKIALPNATIVQTIEMEQFNEGSSLGPVVIVNEDSIETVVAALNGARKTMGVSINDYPVQNNYLIVRFNQEDESRTLCLYSENGNYYIEEPYVGIYKSNRTQSVEVYKVYTGSSINKVEETDGSPVSELTEIGGVDGPTSIRVNMSGEATNDYYQNIGYISDFKKSDGTRIKFDPIEWITLEDTDRIDELEIEEFDMPNGYYIYNYEIEYEVDENTEYRFIDWGNNFASSDEDRFHYSTKDKEKFIEYLNTYTDKAVKVPFWITIKDGTVQIIEEQYVP